MEMPIFIVSRVIEARLHTPRVLTAGGVPFTLAVDTDEQVKRAKRLGYKAINFGVTDLVEKRNAITDHMKRKGWYIGMDDDLRGFTMLPPKWRRLDRVPVDDGTNWRPVYRTKAAPKDYVIGLGELATKCREVGAAYGGVASMENPFFRAKRWGFRRFVKTGSFVMDARAGVQFKHRLCHDSYASAHAVALRGVVVVDNSMFYDHKWYEEGGLGSREDREKMGLLEQFQACVDEFPGLVGLARGKNSALRFLKTGDASVNEWRRKHGWLK